MNQTKIFAHRGFSGLAPENTMEAFEEALNVGADGIETDVRLTRDGRVAVIHDPTVNRTTDGAGKVADYSMDELKKLHACRLHPEYEAAAVPEFAELLDFLKGNSLLLNIEVKQCEERNEELVDKTLRLVREFGLEERIIYSGFNHYTMLMIKEKQPDARVGLLYQSAIVRPWEYAAQIGADYLHPAWQYAKVLEGKFMEESHKNGIGVNVWTIDKNKEIQNFLKWGADSIISNRPDIALKERAEYVLCKKER